MKTLSALVLFQTACIIFLLFRFAGDSAAMRLSAGDEPVPVMRVYSGEVAAPAWHESTQVSPPLDEQRLRRIIREELDARSHRGAVDARSPMARNVPDDTHRKVFVDQQIEYFRSVGRISAEEMNDMQREIAKLDPAGRKDAMSRLMRAMNSGEIRGQL